MILANFSTLFWNILEGFHSSETGKLIPERQQLFLKLIDETDPDIIVLNEAAYGDDLQLDIDGDYIDYYKLLPKYNVIYEPSHLKWGNVIASKYSINSIPTLFHVDRKGIAGIVTIKDVSFLLETFHIHPFWDHMTKYKILENIVMNRNIYDNYIFGGDFNAVHYNDYNPWNSGTPSNVLKSIINIGLHDAFEYNRSFTFPTKMIKETPQDPRVKLDHVFYRGRTKPIVSTVIRGIKYIDKVSDHYPLYIEWEIEE